MIIAIDGSCYLHVLLLLAKWYKTTFGEHILYIFLYICIYLV